MRSTARCVRGLGASTAPPAGRPLLSSKAPLKADETGMETPESLTERLGTNAPEALRAWYISRCVNVVVGMNIYEAKALYEQLSQPRQDAMKQPTRTATTRPPRRPPPTD